MVAPVCAAGPHFARNIGEKKGKLTATAPNTTVVRALILKQFISAPKGDLNAPI